MQIIWIASSIFLGFVLLMLDDRYYDMFAYIIYAVMLLLLFATIFNPHEIKGSRSWLVLGPLRLQPAEFAKFATALAVGKYMGRYGFNIHKWKDFAYALGIVLLPMLFIVAQKETGSALVYLSFFLMFYREGMPGSVLFTGVAMIIYFVVGIKYEDVQLWGLPVSLGKFIVILLLQLFSTSMVYLYCKDKKQSQFLTLISLGTTLIVLLFAKFVVPFDIVWVQLVVSFALIGFLLYCWLASQYKSYLYIALFALGSLAFFYSADYVLRDRVVDYVNDLYGKDHVSQIVTFGRMQARNAIRDVGRVLDIAYGKGNHFIIDCICSLFFYTISHSPWNYYFAYFINFSIYKNISIFFHNSHFLFTHGSS